MLVALLRANPDAFIGGNVNRLKAGAVLQLPDAAQAGATPAAEARQTIAAQSRDFNGYRRKLAGAAATAETTTASRSESGRVQAQVQEQTPASASPDKLTLSKGAVKGSKATPEAWLRKQANEASARVEELSKNISQLSKLCRRRRGQHIDCFCWCREPRSTWCSHHQPCRCSFARNTRRWHDSRRHGSHDPCGSGKQHRARRSVASPRRKQFGAHRSSFRAGHDRHQ